MSSIGQGPAPTEQSGNIHQASFDAVDNEENPVQRGFSNQNSYSRTEGGEAPKAQINAPVLDAPSANAESEKATAEVLKHQEGQATDKSAKGGPKTPGVGVQEQSNLPIRKQTTHLQSKSNELESMGFSKSQINGVLAVADPKDPENSLAPMHSPTARLKDMEARGGDPKLNTLFNTFEDVMVRFSAIKEIPDDLKAELTKDLDTFTKAALNAERPLDIDSATTMLVQIQSKLQNERLRFDQESIRIGQVAAEQRSSNIISKIRESIAKVEESKKSQMVGKIFNYIALVFMAIASVALAVAGVLTGGALSIVAASLMVAATGLMITMTVSSETNNFMMKIFDGLAGDKDGEQDAKIGATVFWAVIMIALSAGAAFAGGVAGAGGAAASTASSSTAAGSSTAATVTATGANTAATTSAAVAKKIAIVTKLGQTAQLIGGAGQIASGGADIGTSVYKYQADTFRAEALEEKAEMVRIQKAIDDAMEGLEKAIQELQNGYSTAASIIKANHETKTTLARNLRA
ncbi:type III secretion system translocon subunit SctE [Endozoicomonas sp. 8E]|uniref:type III secretion system translocon subunit SctE n=1 Tax=Endozoicomonas sp. 8E TaxID=3035692 RepID=UPI002938F5E2|nr:type III secretion system translocon subunit SctE [Endozoicomonas sp. 8E]WOG29311.1 type III secretion system translocon subunit SctE [Endozoicomonas sp. 8E]